jgi:hypothetical protein
MALVTLADIKTFLGITDNSKDAILTMFQESIEKSIINYCETDFATHTATNEIIDGNNSDVLVTKYYPVLSVSSVVLGISTDETGGQVLDATEFEFNESGAITLKLQRSPKYRASCKVTYSYGYSAVPADVKMCVYQSVKAELQRYESNTENVNSRSKEGESESFGGAWDGLSGLPKQIMNKLQAYKNYEFANIPMAQRNW